MGNAGVIAVELFLRNEGDRGVVVGTTRQKHTRECFVVAEEGADTAAIEEAIVTMPNYFADYDTTVTFISQKEPQKV